MDSAKPELVEKIKASNTALVTVSSNPSIDQLAACIGMALLLTKLKKHATAVFSGDIPSTIEFLKPEETLEKTPDSLRDFIISLDKSKADKLRYKVEDKLVKIFITPYRTSINEDDLEFSQGEFNIDLVITLGVENNDDLDKAITAGGNILHDAPIVSINTAKASNLGSINWNVPQASSLCELVAELAGSLGEKLLDEQIATALLTGIVAETSRFSNEKTTSLTMSISSELMAAGANQKLVATELSGQLNSGSGNTTDQAKENDGELDVSHGEDGESGDTEPQPIPGDDSSGEDEDEDKKAESEEPKTDIVSQPPEFGESATPGSNIPKDQLSQDDLPSGQPSTESPDSTVPAAINEKTIQPATNFTPPPPSWVPPFDNKDLETKVDADLSDPSATITKLEETVDSPHLSKSSQPDPTPPSPPPAPEPVSTLKDQLNKLIPQIGPDNTSQYIPSDQPPISNATFPNDLNPKDLKPPSGPKAPPYPPPIVPPPQ